MGSSLSWPAKACSLDSGRPCCRMARGAGCPSAGLRRLRCRRRRRWSARRQAPLEGQMTFLPIVERELRTTARKPWTYWWRCGTALGALTVLLLTMLSERGSNPPAVVSKEAFGILSFITMILCLLAGSFQTYDCLSAEKRDGTIGLLFLTDLKGYDVVLGKLAANSLHTIYGLAALLPVLAIPLLAGGVTAGEFWRVVPVLLASLFFSLGVGMCVSAFSRETRLSLATALMVVIFFTAILPVLHEVPLEIFRVKATPTCMFWPCAGYALAHAEDTVYNYRPGREDYWCSMVTIVGLGFAGLLIAAWRLPRAWQDRAHSSQKRKRPGFWRRLRYGSPRRIGRRR